MVFGLALLAAAIPTTIGTSIAVNEQQKHSTQSKFNLVTTFTVESSSGLIQKEALVVLRDGRVSLTRLLPLLHPLSPPPLSQSKNTKTQKGRAENCDGQLWLNHPPAPIDGHKFTGQYMSYPSTTQHQGLVSSIQDDPPILNWIFVDDETLKLRYGNRTESIEHISGPWGWNESGDFLTLGGKEEFWGVEEEGVWAVYFGGKEDGDEKKLPEESRKAKIKLRRKMVGIEVKRLSE
jgi:hypothetical protein